MKKWTSLTALLLSVCLVTYGQTGSPASLDGFEWLLGKWERQNNRPGQVMYESWTKTSGSRFTGYGWTMKGNDTVFAEKLNLEIRDGNIYYIADVSQNTAPVLFKVVAQSATSFVSANPEHDFPKEIAYTLDTDGILTATISGDGKQIPFRFKKAK